jgi:hypothetical protein
MEIILKNKILSIVAALTLIVSVSLVGFAGLSGTVSANIPFDFTVGNKEFKAGKYSVERLFASNTSDALVIRSADNSEAASFNVNRVSGKGNPQARLVFRRYGNQYFLGQIFDGQGSEGFGLLKSKAERELAKKRDTITQIAVEPEVVTVAARTGQ